jgi:hypothetical protein
MWIYSIKGFVSVVQHEDDSNRVVIRSRLKIDIQSLKEMFESMGLKTSDIAVTTKADYKYRFVADRADWITVMIKLIQDVKYTNFKDAVYKADSRVMRDKRHDVYLDIWSVSRRLQNLEK